MLQAHIYQHRLAAKYRHIGKNLISCIPTLNDFFLCPPFHRSPDCWSSRRSRVPSMEEPDSPSTASFWTLDPQSTSTSTGLRTAPSSCERVFVAVGVLLIYHAYLLLITSVVCFRRLSSEVIKCVMPPAELAVAENVSVCVVYDGRPCLSASPSFTFTYEKNPTISHIRPAKASSGTERTQPLLKKQHMLVRYVLKHCPELVISWS